MNIRVAKLGGTVAFIGALSLMAAVACQAAPASPGASEPIDEPTVTVPVKDTGTPNEPTINDRPTQPPAATTPAGPTPSEPAAAEPIEEDLIEQPAPIESVEVVWDSATSQYTVRIVSGLPSGCVTFGEYATSVEGDEISVAVINLTPAEPMPCTTIYGYHKGEIPLDGLEPGQTYTVAVNGEVTNSFTARDAEDREMVLKESPIDGTEIIETDSGYALRVISRLPRGSSCSQFNGYDISRPSANNIRVTVTHYEVADDNVPCTRDLPAVETEIPLGADFTPGEAYKILVNGEVTNSFTARDAEDREMVLKQSPIEVVELVILESFPPQYRLNVLSRLPRGSSCSQFNGYDVTRPFSGSIEITVTHYEVAEDNVPCTADLPVVETDIPLGMDFESGAEYTITVNGQVTETFTAQ